MTIYSDETYSVNNIIWIGTPDNHYKIMPISCWGDICVHPIGESFKNKSSKKNRYAFDYISGAFGTHDQVRDTSNITEPELRSYMRAHECFDNFGNVERHYQEED